MFIKRPINVNQKLEGDLPSLAPFVYQHTLAVAEVDNGLTLNHITLHSILF